MGRPEWTIEYYRNSGLEPTTMVLLKLVRDARGEPLRYEVICHTRASDDGFLDGEAEKLIAASDRLGRMLTSEETMEIRSPHIFAAALIK